MRTKITNEDSLFVLRIDGIVYGRFRTYKQATSHKLDIRKTLKRKEAHYDK